MIVSSYQNFCNTIVHNHTHTAIWAVLTDELF